MQIDENPNFPRRILNNKVIRFVMGGGLVAGVNIAAVYLLLRWEIPMAGEFGKNLSHIIGTEFALLCSFHIHNYWTWRRRSESYARKLWDFHVVTGFTIGLRIIIFFLLNRVGVHPLAATVAGIAVAVVLNFLGYDKLVFKRPDEPKKHDENHDGTYDKPGDEGKV